MGSLDGKSAAQRAADDDAADPSLRILDGEAFLKRLEGDRPLARELLALFDAHVPAQLEALRAAVLAQDPVAIESAAHGLKGVLTNIHAERATHAALRLERLGRSGEAAGSAAAFASLLLQMQQLAPALQAFRQERLS